MAFKPDAVDVIYLEILDKPILGQLIVDINLLVVFSAIKLAVEFLMAPGIRALKFVTAFYCFIPFYCSK